MNPEFKVYIWPTQFKDNYHYKFLLLNSKGVEEYEILLDNGIGFEIGKIEHTNEGLKNIIELANDIYKAGNIQWIFNNSNIAYNVLKLLWG